MVIRKFKSLPEQSYILYIMGVSGPSLFIESTDSMIILMKLLCIMYNNTHTAAGSKTMYSGTCDRLTTALVSSAIVFFIACFNRVCPHWIFLLSTSTW